MPALPKDATAATRAAQAAERARQPLHDTASFDDAVRGFIAPLGSQAITDDQGRTVWSLAGYEFLDREQAPETVHPGLWRHARANLANGLYKVCDRLYQLRGFDISNMTVIEGDSGLILIDPLVSTETAAAALALYFAHRPRRPVVAVIYTHSHADHFGGVRGVIDEADVQAGRVSVWAPSGFLREAIGENVIAGPAMTRRAHYQFGGLLPRGERGQVDAGLGKATSGGTITLIPPTHTIEQPRETHVIDGVEIVFELTPDTEAPSEMIMHYPQLRVLNMAELTSQNIHNLLPMRGAQVRDALAWAGYLGEALQRYGAQTDVLIAQHQWPVWGAEAVQTFLEEQRDAYKLLHDQSVRLLNHGYTAAEAAELIELPASLQQRWHTHCFYGCLKHNVKAVFQRYIGHYDGHPANLEPLPPVPAARKAIAYMGGAEAVRARAREDFERGEYRWVAEICARLVLADPTDAEARTLAADALEQLGYQSESATARNSYLQGAAELRDGTPRRVVRPASADLVRAMTLRQWVDYLGVRLNGPRAGEQRLSLNWHFEDTGEHFVLRLRHGALTADFDARTDAADATVRLRRATLDAISLRRLSFAQALSDRLVTVEGPRPAALSTLLGLLDEFDPNFPIVEPRPWPQP